MSHFPGKMNRAMGSSTVHRIQPWPWSKNPVPPTHTDKVLLKSSHTLVHTVSESFLQPVSEGVVSSIHLTAQKVLQQRVLSFGLYQDLAKDSKVHNDT